MGFGFGFGFGFGLGLLGLGQGAHLGELLLVRASRARLGLGSQS